MDQPIRDPQAVIHALRVASTVYPTQRITQIIMNALGTDLFYIEDKEAAQKLLEYVQNYRGETI